MRKFIASSALPLLVAVMLLSMVRAAEPTITPEQRIAYLKAQVAVLRQQVAVLTAQAEIGKGTSPEAVALKAATDSLLASCPGVQADKDGDLICPSSAKPAEAKK